MRVRARVTKNSIYKWKRERRRRKKRRTSVISVFPQFPVHSVKPHFASESLFLLFTFNVLFPPFFLSFFFCLRSNVSLYFCSIFTLDTMTRIFLPARASVYIFLCELRKSHFDGAHFPQSNSQVIFMSPLIPLISFPASLPRERASDMTQLQGKKKMTV